MIATIRGIMRLLFFIISCMISHLGENPEKGGKPPVDIRVTRMDIRKIGALFQLVASEMSS